MIIDIHGHVLAPPELYAYQSSLLASRGAHGRGRVNVSDERLLSAVWMNGKTHLELLDAAGTDIQFISPRPFQMIHSQKPEKIVHWYTEEANNIIARVCKLLPNRFRGVGGLPQNMDVSPKNTLEEMERCVKELGFVGIMLNPDPNEGQGVPPGLGDEYWYPIYEKAVELDVPLLVHSASCLNPRESYSLHFINEETTAVISLLNSKVFQDFPNLKIVISHGGGAVPYQIGRWMAGRYQKPGAEPFEESIRRLYFDTCLYTKEALELLFKVVGTDRCMFGSETPGTGTAINPNTGRSMDDTRPIIESIEFLTEEQKKMIFSENAKKVYNLKL